ncbi:citrate lyase holo-[acyl-carrier protein] synthase [Romboutsia weinsteinii]|uniref:Citrate lyase holo-[acyl-carrier protein] synthase n=1 Tax=Romboutsia weinsteinii TaxID=2020949 RepID=A0A371IZX9_9FIRM|nr:citrate lyase holo-[acyl-carrier protein] synthase [Romboutsia weinsteinii]RDY26013.1 citrate lyase holo-[acyl-carrier protein] synthase [Romboutsia weinsteinii]
MDTSLIEEFLFDREKRVWHQEDLLKKNKDKTLVTVRINYPGIEKSNYITDDIVNIIYNEMLTYYSKYIVYYDKYKNKEGLICHFLFNVDFVTIKKLMIDIEEKHILGRCVDIDVYTMKDDKVIGISRSHLYKKTRKCFICNLDAKICSRAQTHSVEDIKKYFEDIYSEYTDQEKKRTILSYKISQMALKAMISEVSTYPSFGLVSPISQGSHKDMNYYTFLDSSIAITPYLKKMAEVAYTYQDPKYIFDAIREVGKTCEEEMFIATENINTHKGMIFLMGITISAIAKASYHNYNFNKANDIMKEMVENILDDFKHLDKKEKLTHGEKLYIEHRFTGIRGQVKDGLSILFYNIVDKYKDCNLDKNSLYTQILIELMAIVEDSTIVYRHDIDTLNKVREDAKELLSIGGVFTEDGKNKALSLEKEYIKKNISPGGCADLLAISILLIDIKKSNILN